MKGTYRKAELVFGLTRLAGLPQEGNSSPVSNVGCRRILTSSRVPASTFTGLAPAKDVVPEEFSLNVTGVGLISPLGVGTEQNRKAILNVRSGIVHIRVQICKRGKGFCTGRLHRAKRREAHPPVSALEIIF